MLMSDDEPLSGEVADERIKDMVEWDDDFQPIERQRFAWGVIAAQLRTRPGRWARIPDASPSTASMIRHRRVLAFNTGRWQAASRGGKLYVRFLGPDFPALDGGGDDE